MLSLVNFEFLARDFQKTSYTEYSMCSILSSPPCWYNPPPHSHIHWLKRESKFQTDDSLMTWFIITWFFGINFTIHLHVHAITLATVSLEDCMRRGYTTNLRQNKHFSNHKCLTNSCTGLCHAQWATLSYRSEEGSQPTAVYNRWTGLVDWTTGLIDFHLKRTFRGSIMRCNGGK